MREMKDSGIEWIGKISVDWKTKRNKYVMYKYKDICLKFQDQPMLSLTMNEVIERDIDNSIGKMPTTFDGYQKVKEENLLMYLFDIVVTPRCIGLITQDGLTSPAYSQFIIRDKSRCFKQILLLTSTRLF